MRNIPLLVVTLFATVAMIVGVAVLFSRSATPEIITDQAKLLGDTKNVKGPDAPVVTVVEFSDLQCPACRATQPLVTELRTKYADKVKVVFRHFPLTQIHPYATVAGLATEAAAEQGKFWEMHDLLFERQDEWAELESEAKVREQLIKYAQEIQIDKDRFVATIDSDVAKKRVAQDLADGTALNIQATPTFFVNGQKTAPQQLLTTVESMLN